MLARSPLPETADAARPGPHTGDGGGKASQLAKAVRGAENVARLLGTVFPWLIRIDVSFEPHEVNGQPGAIFRDRGGKVLHTLALDVLDGQIQTVRAVINPDKIGHIGPVADAAGGGCTCLGLSGRAAWRGDWLRRMDLARVFPGCAYALPSCLGRDAGRHPAVRPGGTP